jgi:hypothetical protein
MGKVAHSTIRRAAARQFTAMPSKAEQIVSQELWALLSTLPDGAEIADSEQFGRVLSGLEFFLPEILREIYPEWKWESLDGVYPHLAHKVGEGEVEIFGVCILISDQTLTPIHLCLQVSPSTDKVSWLQCRLGERDGKGMVRVPFSALQLSKRLQRLDGRVGTIDWVYKATFGERSP